MMIIWKGKKKSIFLKDDEKILVQVGKLGSVYILTIDINIQRIVDEALTSELLTAKSAPNTKYLDRSYVTISNPNDGSILAISGKMIQNGKVSDYSIGTITGYDG